MPAIKMEYLLPAKMQAMHPDWKELKDKYAEPLNFRKIKFDKKMGPMLDKRPTLYKSIHSYKAGNPTLLVSSNLKAYKANAEALQKAAASYQTKIKVLGDPAKAELAAYLVKVVKAAQNDVVWADFQLAALKPKKK